MADKQPHEVAQRVFKIVPEILWVAAETIGRFTGSDDDRRDGFIHLSSAAQVEGTLNKYFKGQSDLLLVAFDASDLGPHLKWEASRGGALFPHYYGALPTNLALWQHPLNLEADGLPALNQDLFSK